MPRFSANTSGTDYDTSRYRDANLKGDASLGRDPPTGAMLLLLEASDSDTDSDTESVRNRRGSVNTQILSFLDDNLETLDNTSDHEEEKDEHLPAKQIAAARPKFLAEQSHL